MARVCGTEALTKPVRRWQWCRAGRQAAETRTPPPGRAWPLRYNAVKVPLKGNLVRAPAGPYDIDERIINPCIAAGIARNSELDGVTPWEIRSIYPETYDPLVAQMRANVAPMLAEFGDDAGARNILLDGFRDDCIRGARGETEIVDWSEAEVRELLSLSQQEATQYEIPLLNVNGEPYFPGERCDSPWIEHTPIAPIASWMDPSDIGWLCESAPASEYVSTPGSARFCYTTGGERGWEQGFFGCESAPDARQRALRNNADWLQGWTRSQ